MQFARLIPLAVPLVLAASCSLQTAPEEVEIPTWELRLAGSGEEFTVPLKTFDVYLVEEDVLDAYDAIPPRLLAHLESAVDGSRSGERQALEHLIATTAKGGQGDD